MNAIEATKHMWGQLTEVSLNMKTIVCGGCGIPFAIPENYFNKLVNTNGSFHCPNGCSRQFTGDTEADKLKRQLQQKSNELAQTVTAKIQLESQLNRAKKQLDNVSKGKCPCCGKLYKHLEKHMATKHPKIKH